MEGTPKGTSEGASNRIWNEVRSGKVQVWFSLQPKFNSFELDSEVGGLVLVTDRVSRQLTSSP